MALFFAELALKSDHIRGTPSGPFKRAVSTF
jgi:hypothetical protein